MNIYQKKAAETFKEHKALASHESGLCDWTFGLCGEAGEVADTIKHFLFHNEGEEDAYRMELAKELGDVLWYISAIATQENIRLNDIALLNEAKLKHRYKQGYNDTASAARHEEEEKFSSTIMYQALKSRICHKLGGAPYNVILMGPDGSGKTTIAKNLAKALHLDYVKCDYRQEDKVQLSKEYLTKYTNRLYDRFYFPDDILYCKLKGIWSPELSDMYADVMHLVSATNTIFIYVYADIDTLRERSSAWADDYVKVEDLKTICTLYEQDVIPKLKTICPVIYYDNSKPLTTPEEFEIPVQTLIEDIMLKRIQFF